MVQVETKDLAPLAKRTCKFFVGQLLARLVRRKNANRAGLYGPNLHAKRNGLFQGGSDHCLNAPLCSDCFTCQVRLLPLQTWRRRERTERRSGESHSSATIALQSCCSHSNNRPPWPPSSAAAPGVESPSIFLPEKNPGLVIIKAY